MDLTLEVPWTPSGEDAVKCREWTEKITASWNRSFESIIETGRLLIQAKQQLRRGYWLHVCTYDLPFREDTAERLMKIARHPCLSDSATWRYLPLSYRALSELAKLSLEQFAACFERGDINPEMRVFDAALLARAASNQEPVLDKVRSEEDRRELAEARQIYLYAIKRLNQVERANEISEFFGTLMLPMVEVENELLSEPHDIG